MNHLYQLLCVPKAPSVSIDDLKSGNLDQFLSTSMRSSAGIEKDSQLKQGATQELTKLLRSRSNSPRNTLKMVNTMFENASQACHHSRERALIDWLQTCVSTAIQLSLDPESLEKPGRVPEPKKSPKKNKSPAVEGDETDVSWEEDDGERYEYLGDSDEDYMPSDDGVVPSKKKKSGTKTSPRKKKNQDQVVPPSPPKSSKDAVIPVLHEGAGAKALQKYFADLESKQVVPKSTSNALADGYFVRAFFFPSKDSFNAFMSALNSAKKTLDICVFAFTDDDVADALIAAKKRGVSIRIITDNQQAAGKGADAKRLQEQHGIPFKTDHTTGYMHNKFAIIDGATLINGSFNWSKG
ncbi:Mitochondrial cardiolipin hydrolase [Choanephora cucurbitarum]|uniref:Mitochondrial cardiolipin hydrolase n=1 Tax=Choanephora cucurbitarum TaxID=101091 RepID=A0A1C7N472_9FUNG|nr:Mitochondrial cardiolipin hydrolase [Choanephora cucurbitarum]